MELTVEEGNKLKFHSRMAAFFFLKHKKNDRPERRPFFTQKLNNEP